MIKNCLLCKNYNEHPCECEHSDNLDNFSLSKSGKNLISEIEKDMQKTSYWRRIRNKFGAILYHVCDNCSSHYLLDTKYCPDCGSKMSKIIEVKLDD